MATDSLEPFPFRSTATDSGYGSTVSNNDGRDQTASSVTTRRLSNDSSPPLVSTEQSLQPGGNCKKKRKDMNGDGFESSRNDEDEDDDQRCKKTRVEDSAPGPSPRKLACPYYKRNPLRHQKHRSCAGPGWATVHRVKEHVFRQHCIPIHCHRCGEIFETEPILAAHQRLPESCRVEVVQHLEGCSKEQMALLRKRKKGVSSETEKWRDVFKCLFPDDEDETIPTPYYDDEQVADWESRRDDEFAQYERYLVQELPRIVRQRLEQSISESENELRSQLVDIVRDAMSTLSHSYRQNNVPQNPSDLPERYENEVARPRASLLDAEEPPQMFDFSLLYAPPPLSDTNSTSFGICDATTLSTNTNGNCPPISDSRYGFRNTNLEVHDDTPGDYDGRGSGWSEGSTLAGYDPVTTPKEFLDATSDDVAFLTTEPNLTDEIHNESFQYW